MKILQKECPMCGENFPYYDLSNVPNHCGSLKCKRNWEYQQANVDVWGNHPSTGEIDKWEDSKEQTKKSEKQS